MIKAILSGSGWQQKQYEEIQQESVVIPTENTESPMEIDAEIYDTVPEVDLIHSWSI